MTSARPEADRDIATLSKRSDFLKANRGWRWVSPAFILLIHPRGDNMPYSRAGYTVTKKTGNAVVRNRIKRRFRALVREILPDQGIKGADHIFIGRTIATEHEWSAMRDDLVRALKNYRKDPDKRPKRGGQSGRKKPAKQHVRATKPSAIKDSDSR
jgi:ribonuclease P protein component